jgi:hypothetical protein
MSWVITGAQKTDPDALAYLAEVERADGQALESGVRDAVIAFVTGCKADGIWSAIKASCILAGARTLTGALVPLVGVAPTNFNFTSGDYNRKTGLVGNESSKYLNSNRNANADNENNVHMAARVSALSTNTATIYLGASVDFRHRVTGLDMRISQSAATPVGTVAAVAPDFVGGSRSTSTSFVSRSNGANSTVSVSSASVASLPVFVFAQNISGTPTGPTGARLAFYSIGESLDLALLDARVTTLINAFDAAI